MPQQKLPAVFMRGGTSKAVMFHARDLPASRDDWAPIFLSLMGSPDPSMRQLDGMGGGVSSLSKVCIIGPSSHPDADVDYTFAQVRIERAHVDYGINCGNMSSAIGPFAMDEGLVPAPSGKDAVVRIHNTNTKKIIVSRFLMDGGPMGASPVGARMAAVDGDMAIDGVAGTGSPVRLEFLAPGGARTGKLLPSGKAAGVLDVAEIGRIPVSMIDAANPYVFVPADAVGVTATEKPAELEANLPLMKKLEAIRRSAAVAMGIARDTEAAGQLSGPGIAMVAAPVAMTTLSGRQLAAADMDIAVRFISNGQPHRASPMTGAMCLAVATRVPGSIPNELARKGGDASQIRIGHPSGRVVVDAKVDATRAGAEPYAEYAAVYRTTRRLFEGRVLYRAG